MALSTRTEPWPKRIFIHSGHKHSFPEDALRDQAIHVWISRPVLERITQAIHDANSYCAVCEALCRCLAHTNPHEALSFDFGLSIERILAINCSYHRSIFRTMKNYTLELYKDPRWLRSRLSCSSLPGHMTFGLCMEDKPHYFPKDPGNSYHRHQQLHLGLLECNDVPDHPGRWKHLIDARIDGTRILHWKNWCATVHGHDCTNTWGIQTRKPSWLIDVYQSCLVPGEDVESYICLSYRWGKTLGYQTQQSFLGELQQPGYFSQLQARQRLPLPPTILDAMQLVRVLDERYLWADTVCIIQDDEKFKLAEMEKMGEIYGGAFLTIVAADGDGDIGIPGVSNDKDLVRRKFYFGDQTLVPLSGDPVVLLTTDPARQLTQGTGYATRGWTFQEYEMASRKLVFANNKMYWKCNLAMMDEQCTETSTTTKSPLLTQQGVPNLPAYWAMVWGYTPRELTYNSDALWAITGMLTVLESGFEGGFHFGLPIMFFDLALCWDARNDYLEKRTKPNQISGGTVTDGSAPHLPSWSWIAWRGRIVCCEDEDGFTTMLGLKTFAITTWYASRTPFGEKDYPIPSWFRNRSTHHEPDEPLPSGWKRHKYEPQKRPAYPVELPSNCCRVFVFEHEDFAGQYFWHHFPIAGRNRDTGKHNDLTQMLYVVGRTTRAWIEAYRVLAEYGSTSIHILDHLGRRIGRISPDLSDDVPLFPVIKDGVGKKIELAAICRRENHTLLPCDTFTWEVDCYAFLWIEWINGVAYRKGSGTVKRSFWDNHPTLEKVDLVLG